MGDLRSLGLGGINRPDDWLGRREQVLTRPVLRRVLAFTGKSIDDVVNDPIARNMVRGYYRLHRQIERRSEIVELERWWNNF